MGAGLLNRSISTKSRDIRDAVLLLIAGGIACIILGYIFPILLCYPADGLLPLQLHFRQRPRPSGKVVIAAIDDRTTARLGRMPLSATQYADLLATLGEQGASVIGFEPILFGDRRFRTSTSDDPGIAVLRAKSLSGDDDLLLQMIDKQKIVDLGSIFGTDLPLGAVPVSNANAVTSAGAIAYNVLRGPPVQNFADWIMREYQPPFVLAAKFYFGPSPALGSAGLGTAYVDYMGPVTPLRASSGAYFGRTGIWGVLRLGDTYYVPMPIALVSRYYHSAKPALVFAGSVPKEVLLGSHRIPLVEDGSMWVNLRHRGAIPQYSVADIISHDTPTDAFTNKIVLVGDTSAASLVATYDGSRYPVEIDANAIEDALCGRFLTDQPWIMLVGFTLGGSFLALFLIPWSASRPSATAAIWSLAVILIYLVAAFTIATAYVAWSGIVGFWGGGAAILIPAYSAAMFVVTSRRRRERNKMRTAFEHYLDPKIIETVINDPAGLELGGERRHLSVLFADIVNFTTRAEALSPESLIKMLNDFMSTMTEIVLKHGGISTRLSGTPSWRFGELLAGSRILRGWQSIAGSI
ncbi:MAG: CHASE2 domain-containing protein [Candidatus Binataceae bacterium]